MLSRQISYLESKVDFLHPRQMMLLCELRNAFHRSERLLEVHVTVAEPLVSKITMQSNQLEQMESLLLE